MEKVKKLFFTLLISVAAIVPVITNAETINVKTMDELLSAVNGDNTVILDENITLDSSLVINGNNVVLDLNGKTLTANKYIDLVKGSLEITGKGTIKDVRELSQVASTIYVEGSTNKNDTGFSMLNVGENVTIETKQWAIAVWDTSGFAYGVTVNFDGKIISTGDRTGGITIQGNIANDNSIINAPVVNLSKTTSIKASGSDAFPIYQAGMGIINVAGGNYEGVKGTYGIKRGVANISEGTLIATADPTTGVGYGNGIKGTGAAIQIESNDGYKGGITVNIAGNPNITSQKGNAIYHYIAENSTSKLERIAIVGGNINGNLQFEKDDNVEIQSGIFTTSEISKYLKTGYKMITLVDSKYTVTNINYTDVEGANFTYTVNDKENVYSASMNDKIKMNITAETGYYIKNVTVKDSNNNTINVENNTFNMPEGSVTITVETARYLEKESNIVEVSNKVTADTSIKEELSKELINANIDNKNSGLVKSLDKEKLQITNISTTIETRIDSKLVKYDEKTNKITYEIKPMYSINGIDYTEIPNEALNGGKIRINLPIPSSVKDTHAKVKHINNDKVIDEKEYEIKKTEDGEKYITIETTSFSTFEISYFTAKNLNPQTSDNVMTYVIMLLGSALTIGIVVVLKKHFN